MWGGPRFTPVVALQGEIRESTMKCRDMKSKLKIVKHRYEDYKKLPAEGCGGEDFVGGECWMDEASGGVYACSCWSKP